MLWKAWVAVLLVVAALAGAYFVASPGGGLNTPGDVAEPKGTKPIWRGWAEGVIQEGMSDDRIRAEVTEAIRRILEKFPPPATRKKK